MMIVIDTANINKVLQGLRCAGGNVFSTASMFVEG